MWSWHSQENFPEHSEDCSGNMSLDMEGNVRMSSLSLLQLEAFLWELYESENTKRFSKIQVDVILLGRVKNILLFVVSSFVLKIGICSKQAAKTKWDSLKFAVGCVCKGNVIIFPF